MQEIVILLSSLAGIATAIAIRAGSRYYDRSAKNGPLLTLGAGSRISGQLRILGIEKEILAKSITRLYQSESDLSNENRKELLARYQHQLGVVMAKLEKLEDAKKHPDLGPVGDGLITLMDQKLSKLDTRLYDLSSAVADIRAQTSKSATADTEGMPAKVHRPEKPRAPSIKDSSRRAETAAASTPVTAPKRTRPLEITTLTPVVPEKEKQKPPPLEIKGDRQAGGPAVKAAAAQDSTASTVRAGHQDPPAPAQELSSATESGIKTQRPVMQEGSAQTSMPEPRQDPTTGKAPQEDDTIEKARQEIKEMSENIKKRIAADEEEE